MILCNNYIHYTILFHFFVKYFLGLQDLILLLQIIFIFIDINNYLIYNDGERWELT
jgi:hypothetical protein